MSDLKYVYEIKVSFRLTKDNFIRDMSTKELKNEFKLENFFEIEKSKYKVVYENSGLIVCAIPGNNNDIIKFYKSHYMCSYEEFKEKLRVALDKWVKDYLLKNRENLTDEELKTRNKISFPFPGFTSIVYLTKNEVCVFRDGEIDFVKIIIENWLKEQNEDVIRELETSRKNGVVKTWKDTMNEYKRLAEREENLKEEERNRLLNRIKYLNEEHDKKIEDYRAQEEKYKKLIEETNVN